MFIMQVVNDKSFSEGAALKPLLVSFFSSQTKKALVLRVGMKYNECHVLSACNNDNR